jgi:hypothetical protein
MISHKNDLWSQYKVLSAKITNIFKGQKEGTGKENYLLHLFHKFTLVQQEVIHQLPAVFAVCSLDTQQG